MVTSAPSITARGQRWEIEYSYKASNVSALELLKRTMAIHKRTVMLEVKGWKQRGYQIEFSDFAFKLNPI